MSDFDAIVIGAGIAGASLAAELAGVMRVLVLEMEEQPGYHTTGRSNAFWHATYGGPKVQPLTGASLDWLLNPPKTISEQGFLSPRPLINIARAEDESALSAFEASFADNDVTLERLSRQQLEALVPGLRPAWDRGIFERGCYDIDVAGLHAAYLKSARRSGAEIGCRRRSQKITGRAGDWVVETTEGSYSTRWVINAAGAWADEVATQAGLAPLGIQPYRRTITQLAMAEPVRDDVPMLIDINGGFYFKPENGRVWLSPHDETPSPACDSAPEEIDIAIAIDRLEHVVDWGIRRVEHSWAGLRSFAPDRLPVYGEDTTAPGFFWCAGQGGFGIQTAPAAAKLCASLITGTALDPMVTQIDAALYAPQRLK
jgi:D-arginine dehydrogenase